MIVELISKYLESNKRLVVPNLGTFIVKEAGRTVLFSNLIKTDDGVLRSLLEATGVSELEAAGSVDRFVFEVNYRLENTGVCHFGGFGELRSGANGTVQFTFNPQTQGENLDGNMAAKLAERKAENEAQSANVPVVEQPVEVKPQPEPTPVIDTDESEEDHIDVMPRQQEVEPKSVEERRPRRERGSNDHIKGLRYGKGHKIVTGRESATSRRSNRSDLIMKIAIGAAIIATLALAYGLYNDWRNSRYMYEGLYDEESYEEPTSTAEDGVTNPDLEYITPNN